MNLKTIVLFFHAIVLIIHSGLGDESETIQKPPEFQHQPPNDVITFESKKDAFIPCEAINHSSKEYSYRWTKDGENLTLQEGNKRLETYQQIYGLAITELKDDDAGKYQCFISNEIGTAMSNSVILRIVEAYQPSHKPKNATATLGKPFHLSCNIPKDAVRTMSLNYWTRQKNGKHYPVENNDRITSDANGTLWFSRIERSDETNELFGKGSYAYLVHIGNKTVKGTVSDCETNLKVVEASTPGEDEPIQLIKRYVSEDNEVAMWMEEKNLYCIYDGDASLNITWSKNDEILYSTRNIMIENPGRYISIKNFAEEDEGTYSCKVSTNSSEKFEEHKFRVTIGKPHFIKGPENTLAFENKTTEIYCNASAGHLADTGLTIEWIYNGSPLNKSDFYIDNLNFSDDNSVLTIENVQKVHTGKYGCNVSNTYSYVYKEAYLIVQKPHPLEEDPSLMNQNSSANLGDTLEWKCPVKDSPELKIEWKKDDTIITNDSDSRISISNDGKSLRIAKFSSSDEAEYVCSATNGINTLILRFKATVSNQEADESFLIIIVFFIAVILIVLAVVAGFVVYRKRADGEYRLREAEKRAAEQRATGVNDQSEIELLTGNTKSANTSTLKFERRPTHSQIGTSAPAQNGTTLEGVQSLA